MVKNVLAQFVPLLKHILKLTKKIGTMPLGGDMSDFLSDAKLLKE